MNTSIEVQWTWEENTLAIPDIEPFQQFLSGLTFEPGEQQEDYGRIEVAAARTQSDLRTLTLTDPISLWYPKKSTLSPEAAVSRIGKELASCGHLAHPDIARVVLAFSCATTTAYPDVNHLNRVLSAVVDAQSSQFMIAWFPPHPDMKAFDMGRFRIGLLRRENLVYRCQRVDCDYFERYPRQFSNNLAIEGDAIPLKVVDLPEFSPQPRLRDLVRVLSDTYFEVLSSHLRRLFFEELWSAQEFLIAAGAPYMNFDQPFFWQSGAFIAVFQNIGPAKWGYFCPFGLGGGIDFAKVDVRVPEKARQLREIYQFHGFTTSEVHITLRSFGRFLAKARVHEAEGRRDEAFLHYMIALDLLFSERDSSTQSIARRTAMVVCRPLAEELDRSISRVKELYERRSRYVHQGESVTEQDLQSIKPLADEVLACLLRLQGRSENHVVGFVGHWIKKLDYLLAAEAAGRPWEIKELEECGIAPDPSYRAQLA